MFASVPAKVGRNWEPTVDSDVDDNSSCAESLSVEIPESIFRILKEPEFIHESFCVKRPALDEGGVAIEAHERGQRLIFLRQADLEVVPRHRLVQVERLLAPFVAVLEVVGVVEE